MMPITIEPPLPHTQPLAGCNEINDMIGAARAKYNELASDPVMVIDSHARTVEAALAKTQGERAATVEKLTEALGSTGDTMVRLGTEAVKASADLFLVLAIQTRNPNLIGAAAGADLLIDGAHFILQMVNADDGQTRQKAVLVFLQDRWSTIQSLVSGPGGTFNQKRMEVATALSDLMLALGQAVVDEARLRTELDTAKSALTAIETTIAGLPVNHAEWQQYMLNQLDAEIFVLELLATEYAGTNCQAAPVIPSPFA